jgi:hypothetical protein
MNEWSHLHNARHIDWVIASLKQHPEIWAVVVREIRALARGAALDAAWDAVYDTARGAAWEEAYDAIYAATPDAPMGEAWSASRNAIYATARPAARCPILALIVYDDCAHLLDMSSEQLKTWALLSEQPAAVLLLPAVIAREQIRELESIKA